MEEAKNSGSGSREKHLAQPSKAGNPARLSGRRPWLANGKGSTGLEVKLEAQPTQLTQESSAKRAENVKQGVKVNYTELENTSLMTNHHPGVDQSVQ